MLKRQDRWLGWAACALLASCGGGGSKSERVAQERAELALPLQISPDFAVDHDALPVVNPNATVVNVAASAAGGYLLSYQVDHRPEPWSRVGVGVRALPEYSSTELVFVHWDPLSGPPTTLARIPLGLSSNRVVTANAVAADVGDGWLVVYKTLGEGQSHAVTLARSGTLGSPTPVPAACNLVGLAHGGNTALLTDACGKGVLLDLAGNVVTSLTIATAASFAPPPPPQCIQNFQCELNGGQVAFNGIDYLVVYGFVPFDDSIATGMQVKGFPITLGGEAAPAIDIAKTGSVFVGPTSVAANGSTFLTLLNQGRPSGAVYDATYRVVTESPAHAFAVSDERLLPLSPVSQINPSFLQPTAFTLNGHFAAARSTSNGNIELIFPSSDPTVLDTTKPLGALPNAMVAASNGTRLVVGAGALGVRFDETLLAIDDPPAALFSSTHGQFTPSFAFSGQRYLAAWTAGVTDLPAYRGTNVPEIFAQHLSNHGAILDPASTQLSSSLVSAIDPFVIGNPSFFAASWYLVTTAAATLTTDEPPVLTAFGPPTSSSAKLGIATDGMHSVIASLSSNLELAQFGSAGTWSVPETIPSTADPTSTAPVLAFNGGQYAVLWTAAGNTGERVIYGARVSSGLTLIDPAARELLRFSAPDVNGRSADCGVEVIASGDHFLLAWADVAGDVEELRIARLSSTLAVLDPGGVLVSTQPFPPIGLTSRRVALGWDGSNDWVVWNDGGGGTRRPFASLRGRRFSDSLAPLDLESFLISSDLDEVSKVTLAVGDEGRVLVGYTQFLQRDDSYRVRARFLSSAPFVDGSPCHDAGQCQNGSCVAGLCSTVSGSGGGSGTSGGGTGGGNASGSASGGSAASGSTSGGTGGAGSAAGGNASGDTGGAGSAVGGSTSGDTGGAVSAVGGNTGGDTGGGETATGGSTSADTGDGGSSGSELLGDAGVGGNEDGMVTGGAAGVSGAGDGRGGGASAGRGGSASAGRGGGAGASDGGSKDHSCSVRVAGGAPPHGSLISFASVIAALTWLTRRRKGST